MRELVELAGSMGVSVRHVPGTRITLFWEVRRIAGDLEAGEAEGDLRACVAEPRVRAGVSSVTANQS